MAAAIMSSEAVRLMRNQPGTSTTLPGSTSTLWRGSVVGSGGAGHRVEGALRHGGLVAHLAQRRDEPIATAFQRPDVDREAFEIGQRVLQQRIRERVAGGDLLHEDLV